MKFSYRCGNQPLPGYSVKRGIGYGAFGEVYFAVTDGGKEVALKWIRGNADIELRGVQQCLNLKHSNLLHLYDLRKDDQGNHWLVMEHVSGDPLSQILSRNPKGVAVELAVEWFNGLANAVHYLHENGIVHRDLKPANIFLENGIIKVGDYGLCKTIGSQKGGMTQNVGTCYYMAPEIASGNYSREIDVYAAGVILYEMLTGKVPFEGESMQEVLMKHLIAVPDLRNIPTDLAPIVQQALAKNPAERFSNVADMNRRLASVMRARTEAKESRVTALPVKPIPMVTLAANPTPALSGNWRHLIADIGTAVLGSTLGAGLLAVAWALFVLQADWNRFAFLGFLTVFCAWAVVLPTKLLGHLEVVDTWGRRLSMLAAGALVGLLAVWLLGYHIPLPGSEFVELPNALLPWHSDELDRAAASRWGFPENRSMPVLGCFLGYFSLLFFLYPWTNVTDRYRPHRFSIFPLLTLAFWAFMLTFLLPSAEHRHLAMVAVLGAGILSQLVSPWQERVKVAGKKLRWASRERARGVAV